MLTFKIDGFMVFVMDSFVDSNVFVRQTYSAISRTLKIIFVKTSSSIDLWFDYG